MPCVVGRDGLCLCALRMWYMRARGVYTHTLIPYRGVVHRVAVTAIERNRPVGAISSSVTLGGCPRSTSSRPSSKAGAHHRLTRMVGSAADE
eukprot:4677149-Prymnesium_polylepis.1